MQEFHPYGEWIPPNAEVMIIGSFPIGKFSNPERRHEIKNHEIDFFFGGEKNLLWKLLSLVYETPLSTKDEIKRFLEKEHIAIGDVIHSCHRKKGGASDSDLFDIKWNKNLLALINKHRIQKVFFTSKKVEQWFNRLFPGEHPFQRITLISPSAQSARGLSQRADVKQWCEENPNEKIFQWILERYKEIFKSHI